MLVPKMSLILQLVVYICFVGLFSKHAGGSSDSTAMQLHSSANLKECCADQKDNLVELRTLLMIFLELLGGCDGDVDDIDAKQEVKPSAGSHGGNSPKPKPAPVPPPKWNPPPKSSPPTPPAPSNSGRAPSNLKNCDQLHQYPHDCINNFCDYDCSKKKCVNSGSLTFVKGPSSNYCYNPCQCNKAGFAYNVLNGECKDRKPICDRIEFFPGSCQRANKGVIAKNPCPNIYYGYNGVLCKNEVQKGNCQIEETILAVNLATEAWHYDAFSQFGGGTRLERVTDQDKIEYKFDHQIKYENPHDLLKGDISNHELINGKRKYLTDSCGKILLYGSQIWGDHAKKGPSGRAKGWKGVAYNIPLKKDGLYELSLKTVENQPRYVVGTRAFNIFFNGVWILPEVDILHTAPILHGVDWIINFKVTEGGKKLKMLGYEDSDLNGTAKLAFYYGICGNEDENFHMAAFAVNKFKSK